jgi:hypothetical protein
VAGLRHLDGGLAHHHRERHHHQPGADDFGDEVEVPVNFSPHLLTGINPIIKKGISS